MTSEQQSLVEDIQGLTRDYKRVRRYNVDTFGFPPNKARHYMGIYPTPPSCLNTSTP